ncbi:DEAD/DEAH box helicase [Desulfobulbus elongatus]|uniref:DEAD/DEAH box helicase n=1 Tax=Desulfobulbus elongatus TaxID=53332 RepID=UPI0009FBD1A6|nr:DEAD/DEAH box helicase [Desulfobulbus elongatus]
MSFNRFSLHPHILQAMHQCGYTAPTPIQEQAIPPILGRRDLLGLAQTGTGKTAAFAVPMIHHLLQTPAKGVRALILAPTRELAEQINDFIRTIIDKTGLRCIAVYGGVSKQKQIGGLRNGADIVVACPGRLLDLLNDKVLDLGQVEILVLDEADHMFDKGFLPDIRRILRQLPKQRQSLVFSATMPAEIRHLAEDMLHDPVTVQINPTRSVDGITHHLYAVEQGQKTSLLMSLLQEETMTSTLVFTRTKHRAKNLALQLTRSGVKATSLQGNLSQNKRRQALDGFKSGTFNVLVATDIAARGIDVSGISHVINYDVPDTAEAYIHRTGRTGRASRTGDALTFATGEDGRMIRAIEGVLDNRMCRHGLPALPAAATRPRLQETGEEKKRPAAARSPRQGRKGGAENGRPQRKSGTGLNVFGLSRRSE